MISEKAQYFLRKNRQSPELIDPLSDVELMLDEMQRGLTEAGSSIPMIPTYISMAGELPAGAGAIVIDAGGTNFRSALVRFSSGGYTVEQMEKCTMPGVGKPVTWEDFISFAAERILPLTELAEDIGFCFSYSAQITPNRDGRVDVIDKEVVITGSQGQLVGESLLAELRRRGVTGKRVVVLNDTVAALLGGSANLDKSAYSGFIGQISGTGTNTCCVLPSSSIEKLGRTEDTPILVNLESGMYGGFRKGAIDLLVDEYSKNPGEKGMEKMSSGVYLGELCRLMLRTAADEGLLEKSSAEWVRGIEKMDSAVLDSFAAGEGLEALGDKTEDKDFIRTLSLAIFDRAARCMCINLTAIMLLTDIGRDKPACVCAEGSLIQKCRFFKPMLEGYLAEYTKEQFGRSAELVIGQETTLPGAAVAALLN